MAEVLPLACRMVKGSFIAGQTLQRFPGRLLFRCSLVGAGADGFNPLQGQFDHEGLVVVGTAFVHHMIGRNIAALILRIFLQPTFRIF